MQEGLLTCAVKPKGKSGRNQCRSTAAASARCQPTDAMGDLVHRDAAMRAVCSRCANPVRYGPPVPVEGSQRLFHFQIADNWNAGQCEAQAIQQLPSAATDPVTQTVYISKHPFHVRCNTCGLEQVISLQCPREDGQLLPVGVGVGLEAGDRSIREIREHYVAWRAFHCMPENAAVFEQQNEQAHRDIGVLLRTLDARGGKKS